MTEALIGLMLFGLLSYYSVEYSASGQQILSGLNIDNPDFYSNPNNFLLASGALGTIFAVGTYFVSGGSWGKTLTAGAIAFVAGMAAVPTKMVFASTAPYFVKVLIGGTWIMMMLGAVGAAIRGDF